MTTADIIITNDGNTLYEGDIEAFTNEITIAERAADLYQITIQKTGYPDLTEEYTKAQLESFGEVPLLLYLGI
ncbi:hypothetical protein [Ekhidna lutea]|uniref:hypothetical protein n=1 Tax=Ekhidna lutea TaxID=447679 RepID=UPI000B792192|nr:hypothetical protein [Ekhidna lutea]